MSVLADIRAGMRVVDDLGQHVGTIDEVHPSDGGPVTTRGRRGLPSGLTRALGSTPNVHPQTAARMLRNGYVTITCTPAPRHRYAAAEQIRGVERNVVQLVVSRGDLLCG